LGYDLLGVAEAVDGSGVDPVDAKFKRAVDSGDGFGVVLGTPGVGSVSASNGPCAEADGGELEIGVAEFAKRKCGCGGHFK
jgi:hypothetical protein